MERMCDLLASQHPGRIGQRAAAALDRTCRGDHRAFDSNAVFRTIVEEMPDGIDGIGICARRHRFDGAELRSVQHGEAGPGAADIGEKAGIHVASCPLADLIIAPYQRAEALGSRRCVG